MGSPWIWCKMNSKLTSYNSTPLATASFLDIINEQEASRSPMPSIPAVDAPGHWNNFHSQKVNGYFGRDSYDHGLKNKCGVVSVGGDPDMNIFCNKQIKTFCKKALPGDLVYMNGFLGLKKSKDKATVSHYGVWTGRILTPNLSHPVIKHLIEEHGCNFIEGEIGNGLTHVHDPTAIAIYIELTDFRELPGPHVMGPGRPGTMLYKLLPGQKNRHGQPFPFA